MYDHPLPPYHPAGFQKKITVKQLKATTVLACKCGNTFLVNGHCRNCEAQAIVDKAKQRGDKNFNFEQAIKQQNQSLRKEATIEAGQRAHKLSVVADADLPYTGRIQNFIGQSRRDVVEPWEGGDSFTYLNAAFWQRCSCAVTRRPWRALLALPDHRVCTSELGIATQ